MAEDTGVIEEMVGEVSFSVILRMRKHVLRQKGGLMSILIRRADPVGLSKMDRGSAQDEYFGIRLSQSLNE